MIIETLCISLSWQFCRSTRTLCLNNMSDIATKLRAEIQESKKMRHDFVLRKFAFITVLLGLGSLANKITVEDNITIDFVWLLFLVPVVAIAVDFYILTEDFRIKRAGEFLKSDIKPPGT